MARGVRRRWPSLLVGEAAASSLERRGPPSMLGLHADGGYCPALSLLMSPPPFRWCDAHGPLRPLPPSSTCSRRYVLFSPMRAHASRFPVCHSGSICQQLRNHTYRPADFPVQLHDMTGRRKADHGYSTLLIYPRHDEHRRLTDHILSGPADHGGSFARPFD